MNRKRLLAILTSKTFWGAVAAAVGVVLSAPEITPGVLAQAGGIVLGGAGLRDAIEKLKLGVK